MMSFANTTFAQTGNRPTFNHYAICVKNLKASAAFYEDVILLQKIKHPFADTVHQWFSLGPHLQLHVIQANCPPIVHDINIHLSLTVPSLEDFMRHLDKLNIKYGNWAGDYRKTQLRPDNVTQIYLQDPDGYWIEINDARS
jgi:lactoylglutathione lyase